MKLYQLKTSQVLPISMKEAWAFLSSPFNLKDITPAKMGFEVQLIEEGQKMYPGMIIAYKVRPLLNIPMRWVSEITQVNEPHYFIDEQRFGPYKMWHHQHHLKEVEGGVQMDDIISYVIPFGIFGQLANSLFVRKKLEGIFDHRYKVLEEKFGLKS